MTVLAQLERGNFFSSAITKHCFFPSVHDAVVHISKEPRQASVSTQPRHPHHCDGEVGGGGDGSQTDPSLSIPLRWTSAPECSLARGRHLPDELDKQRGLFCPGGTNSPTLGPEGLGPPPAPQDS